MAQADDVPPPGTQEAIDAGCTCPVMDNPYMGIEGRYVYTEGCPVHEWPDGDDNTPTEENSNTPTEGER